MPLDLPRSLAWLCRAADAGSAEAANALGIDYALGRGVARDQRQAAAWYGRAAAAGSAGGAYNLGIVYRDGAGVARDAAVARHWFAVAAQRYPPGADRNEAARERDRLGGPEPPTAEAGASAPDPTVAAGCPVGSARAGPGS